MADLDKVAGLLLLRRQLYGKRHVVREWRRAMTRRAAGELMLVKSKALLCEVIGCWCLLLEDAHMLYPRQWEEAVARDARRRMRVAMLAWQFVEYQQRRMEEVCVRVRASVCVRVCVCVCVCVSVCVCMYTHTNNTHKTHTHNPDTHTTHTRHTHTHTQELLAEHGKRWQERCWKRWVRVHAAIHELRERDWYIYTYVYIHIYVLCKYAYI